MARQPDLVGMADSIRALREANGMSQEELAIETDMHRTMIGAYERAERKIYLSTVKQILRGLGLTWADLSRELDKRDPIHATRSSRRAHRRR